MNQLSSFDLTDRVIWMPGGGGYLGRSIARGLTGLGARVVIAGRSSGRWEEAVNALAREGITIHGMDVDVSDEASVSSALEQLIERFGSIDSCVNLATFSTGAPYSDMTAQQWTDGLKVTGTGAFLVGRACGEAMSAGGSVVHFSSMYGSVSPDPKAYPPGTPMNPVDYGFAKAGIEQLARYQAVMLGPRGVRVNAVAPGPFPNDSTQRNSEFMEELAKRVPLGRTGKPEELIGVVALLCSDAGSFITGTTITVDGGWTAW